MTDASARSPEGESRPPLKGWLPTPRAVVRGMRHGLLLAVLCTGGCSGSAPLAELTTQSVPPAALMRATRPVVMVALHPPVGPPPVLASRIVAHLNEAAVREDVALVIGDAVAAPASLTGFMIAKAEPARVKFTFVWDVFGPAGTRLGRITGEETVATAASADAAWSVIPDRALEAMAAQVVAVLAVSLPR